MSICLLVVEPWKQQFHVLREAFLDTCGLLLTHFQEKGGYNARLSDNGFVPKVYVAGYILLLLKLISVQHWLFQHSVFHRQICSHAEQRLSQL